MTPDEHFIRHQGRILSGPPSLTDGVAGDDGACNFLTGGQRLESGMVPSNFIMERIKGKEVENTGCFTEEQSAFRRKLESFLPSERKGYRSYLVLP